MLLFLLGVLIGNLLFYPDQALFCFLKNLFLIFFLISDISFGVVNSIEVEIIGVKLHSDVIFRTSDIVILSDPFFVS